MSSLERRYICGIWLKMLIKLLEFGSESDLISKVSKFMDYASSSTSYSSFWLLLFMDVDYVVRFSRVLLLLN